MFVRGVTVTQEYLLEEEIVAVPLAEQKDNKSSKLNVSGYNNTSNRW